MRPKGAPSGQDWKPKPSRGNTLGTFIMDRLKAAGREVKVTVRVRASNFAKLTHVQDEYNASAKARPIDRRLCKDLDLLAPYEEALQRAGAGEMPGDGSPVDGFRALFRNELHEMERIIQEHRRNAQLPKPAGFPGLDSSELSKEHVPWVPTVFENASESNFHG